MTAIPRPDLAAVASQRARLADGGWRPLAVYNIDVAVDCPGKAPKGDGWQLRARRDPPEAATARPERDATNTGLLCDGLRALDIDVDDRDLAATIRAQAIAAFGETIIRTRSNSGRSLLVYRATEGSPAKRVLSGARGKIEVLGHGQQFVAYGMHPSGAPLQWFPSGPDTTPADTVPAVAETAIADFLTAVAPIIGAETEAGKVNGHAADATHIPSSLGPTADALDVTGALACIPNDGPPDWDHWNRAGLATYAATSGSMAGFAAWSAWSERHPSHDPAQCRERWQTYATSPPGSIGAGTLFHMAKEARPGWTRPTVAATRPVATLPDAKRPLTRELPPAPVFPADALGPLRQAAEGLHERVRVPFAIAAQSVLAAATLAMQPHRDVDLPGAGRRPLTGIFASVAESGERKTACDRIALRAVYRFEENLRAQHSPAVAAYAADREAWKSATDVAKKKGKGDRAAIRDALAAIGPEPKAPPHPMLLVADPTSEALILHLQDGRPWGRLFTDEGGALIGGHAMTDDNRMRTGALLNTLWDGSPIRRLRVLSGKAFLPGRRCSAHVMMQGQVAARFFGDETLGGIGTLARVLTVAPETAAGTRFYRETTAAADLALVHHDDRLMALLARPARTTADDPNVLDPPALTLDHGAQTMWIAFHDECERDMRPEGELAGIRAFASKLAEHAGRLAAVLATYADPDTMAVSADHMAAGIRLAQHYAAELLRLGEAASIAPDLQLARRLLAWWQARPDRRCHLAAIYQRGLNAIGDATTARRIVAVLEEHGWITRLPPGTELDGSPRRDAWELTP